MPVCQPHNLRGPATPEARPYGIRVTLSPGNPFRKLLGADWQTMHWFATARERDLALGELVERHRYYRIGDNPDLRYEKVERVAERGR